MIMLLNWILSIITFGTFSLATITMTNVDEYTYETVTGSGITLIDLFGETSAFDGTGYNLIENGTFDTNLNNWSGAYASWNNQSVYLDESTNSAYIYQDISANSSHEYYIRYDVDIVTGTDRLSSTYYSSSYSHSVSGTYSYKLNIINTLFILSTGNAPSQAYYDNVMVLDLTDIYGSGNEPSASEIDTWYATYETALTTNQHEYTYTLNTIDLEDIVVLVSSAFMWYVAIKLFREVI